MDHDIKVIRKIEDFAAVDDAWNKLVDQATLRNSFYRHEWFMSWLVNLAPNCELCVVTLARDDELMAAAPLQVATHRKRGLRLRVLEFLQSGITPRSGLLVTNDALCAPLLRAIEELDNWHIAELRAMEMEHETTRKF